MSVFRRIMLGGGLDVDSLPDTQKIYYVGTEKVTLNDRNGLDANVIMYKYDENTQKGEIICAKDITKIGEKAFTSINLKEIIIPNSVTSIEKYAFYNTSSLNKVTLTDSITSISNFAFYVSTIPEIDILIYNLTKFCTINAFENLQKSVNGRKYFFNGEIIQDLIIPDDVIDIGNYVFCDYDKLTSVHISDSTLSIGTKAFADCVNLKSIYIGKNVNSISNDFVTPSYLENITVSEDNKTYTDYENACLVRIADNWLLRGTSKFIIPDNIITIGTYAFEECETEGDIIIPNSVTNIREYAFYECKAKSFIFNNGLTDIGTYAFSKCSPNIYDFRLLDHIPSIGMNTFNFIDYKSKIVVPDALYDDWILAEYWDNYADNIVKASEYTETT